MRKESVCVTNKYIVAQAFGLPCMPERIFHPRIDAHNGHDKPGELSETVTKGCIHHEYPECIGGDVDVVKPDVGGILIVLLENEVSSGEYG